LPVLNQGRVVEQGATKDVLQHRREEYTVKLVDAVAAARTRTAGRARHDAASAPASAAPGPATSVARFSVLNAAQRSSLLAIARDTWKFYATDVDPTTHLPLDNVTFAGGSATPTGYGRYTLAANIGMYLWAVVAAKDLGLITSAQANDLAGATLTEVAQLAGVAAARAVPGLPAQRPRLLLARAVADARHVGDLHRPAVRAAVPGLGRPLRLHRLEPG
jgi:hypothetical protein